MRGSRHAGTPAPGVEAALRWLLACPARMPDHGVRRLARMRRLDADGPRIADQRFALLTRRALHRRLPDRLELAGLGEIAAHTTCEIDQIVLCAFRRHRPRSDALALLPDAGILDRYWEHPAGDRSAAAMEQLIVSTKLDQDLVDHADSLLDQPWNLRSRAYGLAFAIRVALQLSPTRVLASLIERPALVALPLLQSVVAVVGQSSQARPLVGALIRSGSPLLRVLGARALGGADRAAAGVHDMSAVHRSLMDAGWDGTEAHWIVAQRLKDVAHLRFGARERLERIETGQALARRAPDPLPGDMWRSGDQEAAARQLRASQAHLTKIEAAVVALVSLLAATWPAQAMSGDALGRLDPCMVGGNDLRLAVAEALPAGAAREAMLDIILGTYADRIGLSNPAKALDTYFFEAGAVVLAETRIAARALIMRYDRDRTGPGRRAGQHIGALSDAARAVLARPFARARNPRRHQSAVARLACALVFALEVAMAMPPGRRDEVGTLAELAVEHAAALLRKGPDDESASPYVEQLACSAVWAMRDGLAPDARATWAGDTALAPFARAFAAWTDPLFVAARADLAETLFAAAVRPALRMRPERFSYDRAVTLLDAALATHRDDPATIAKLRRLWDRGVSGFTPYRRDPFSAEALFAAAVAIADLKTDPGLRATLLARLC